MRSEWDKLLKEYEKLLKARERGINKNYTKGYKKLRKELEAIYDKYEVSGQISMDDLRKYNRLQKLDKVTAAILVDLYKNNEKLIRKQLKEIYETTKAASLKTIKDKTTIAAIQKTLKIDNVVNKEVAGKIWTDRIKHHGNNFVYDLHGIIRQGLEAGDTYTQISKSIEKRFGKDVGRVQTMARTESHRVLEDTKYDSFEKVAQNVDREKFRVVKIWHTVSDEAVRDSHRKMEGVTVDYEEEFQLPSGAKTLYPSMSGVPEEDINCRCFIEYRVIER